MLKKHRIYTGYKIKNLNIFQTNKKMNMITLLKMPLNIEIVKLNKHLWIWVKKIVFYCKECINFKLIKWNLKVRWTLLWIIILLRWIKIVVKQLIIKIIQRKNVFIIIKAKIQKRIKIKIIRPIIIFSCKENTAVWVQIWMEKK